MIAEKYGNTNIMLTTWTITISEIYTYLMGESYKVSSSLSVRQILRIHFAK